jgi:hypothetical protein
MTNFFRESQEIIFFIFKKKITSIFTLDNALGGEGELQK